MFTISILKCPWQLFHRCRSHFPATTEDRTYDTYDDRLLSLVYELPDMFQHYRTYEYPAKGCRACRSSLVKLARTVASVTAVLRQQSAASCKLPMHIGPYQVHAFSRTQCARW